MAETITRRPVRAPKVYVRDSGLSHALLERSSWNDVVGHPVVGPSWEGFVIEHLTVAAGEQRVAQFVRTEDGTGCVEGVSTGQRGFQTESGVRGAWWCRRMGDV